MKTPPDRYRPMKPPLSKRGLSIIILTPDLEVLVNLERLICRIIPIHIMKGRMMNRIILTVALLIPAGIVNAQWSGTRNGNTTNYNNGVTATQNGNTTNYSNGVTATRNGNTTNYSNGVTATQNGNTTNYSNGVTATQNGN